MAQCNYLGNFPSFATIPIFNDTRAKYGSEAQSQLDLISQAKELGNLESMWYFGVSAARKAISRIRSAL
jgi:hypothetical protein